jgi:hypothetical protein
MERNRTRYSDYRNGNTEQTTDSKTLTVMAGRSERRDTADNVTGDKCKGTRFEQTA